MAVCLLAATALAASEEIARKDFAHIIPVSVEGSEGLASATLPLAVYIGSERRDLGDIRVYNNAGESLPHALLSPPANAPQQSAPVKVPVFPLWAQTGVEAGALSVRIEQGSKGAIVGVRGAEKTRAQPRLAGYIVDTSTLRKPIQAIVIDWKTGAKNAGAQGFSGEIDIESSDNLGQWTSRVRGAPLVTLQHDGDSLTLNRVEIPYAEAKYLRLSWPAAQETPEFTQVRVETASQVIDATRTFTTAVGVAAAKPGEYQFDVKAAAPFDRLRVALPNPNTVANVQLLARSRADDPWRPVVSVTVYRMTQGGKEFNSPDIAIYPTPEREWLLRVDGRTQLGQGVPILQAGFLPQRIVFTARGGPFTLAFGSAKASSAAIPIATLVPGYRENEPLQTAITTLGEAQAQAGAPPRESAWMDWRAWNWKQIVLWAVLLLGVALLAWMALRLGGQMKSKETADS